MADIVIINPRFDISFWGMELVLPLMGKRAATPVACLPLLAALTPAGHDITLIDENVEAIDFERCSRADIVGVTGMGIQRHRMKEILADLKRRGVFTVVGGPMITMAEDYFGDLVDVLFIGEAEETWPRFLTEWQEGRHQTRYEQAEKSDMSKVAMPRFDKLKMRHYLFGSLQFSRVPVSVRVLRHHRHVRPTPPDQDIAADYRRTGGDPRRECASSSSSMTT